MIPEDSSVLDIDNDVPPILVKDKFINDSRQSSRQGDQDHLVFVRRVSRLGQKFFPIMWVEFHVPTSGISSFFSVSPIRSSSFLAFSPSILISLGNDITAFQAETRSLSRAN